MKKYEQKPLKEKVSITLDSDLIEKIKEQAYIHDRSFSQCVNLILKEYLHNLADDKSSILK